MIETKQKGLKMNTDLYRIPADLMGKTFHQIDIKNPVVYGNFLAQSFYYVSHSTRLLAFAAGLMKKTEESYFKRFVKHIAEESAHEVLAERDLSHLGMKVSDFPQLPETKALWEPQYYKALHESPLAIMGYIISLELFSSLYLPELYLIVKNAHGEKASVFLKLHAEEDPDHTEKAIALTEQLPGELQQSILANALQTAKSYSYMLRACEDNTTVKAKNQVTPIASAQ